MKYNNNIFSTFGYNKKAKPIKGFAFLLDVRTSKSYALRWLQAAIE